MPAATSFAALDHLVVMAHSLAHGVAWCEATLGVTPGPGGEHPLMGTHNRLLRLGTPDGHAAYLEIIAINSVAVPTVSAGARRWFDMDDLALRERVRCNGPQLIHWVARVADITAGAAALAAQGIDRGAIVRASRESAGGLLQWQISVRSDGKRLFDGCLPTLIQWGDTHPTHTMFDSGVALQSLHLRHPQETALTRACRTIGLQDVPVALGPARLSVALQTPRGLTHLHT